MGTEKIEEDIEILFPKARIARMDLDSTRSKYAYKQLIDDFEQGAVDILIGTQMVSKGLDFARVSVVGILNADSLFNFPDFRSFERAYQLITQVRGRAGRGKDKGMVYLQTTQTTHPVVNYIANNLQEEFYTEVLAERRQYDYPPFSRLFDIKIISKDLHEVNHLSQELFGLLKPIFEGKILGPEFPMVSKIKNQYHKAIMIKAPKQEHQQVRRQIFEALNTLQHKHQKWIYRVSINVDPI
jgi:primosomal protein N' (replication factor Y)